MQYRPTLLAGALALALVALLAPAAYVDEPMPGKADDSSKPAMADKMKADMKADMKKADIEAGKLIHAADRENPTVAYTAVEILLEASARSVDRVGARPTIISREMVIPATAMYDAWTAYDARAVGRHCGDRLRRPLRERTAANKRVAVAYAFYRALVYVYPEDEAWITQQVKALGVDPDNRTTNLDDPVGVGNTAAALVIADRRRDGANQHGDEVGSNGKAYSDFTFYEPRNPHDKIIDPDRWQEIPWVDDMKGTFYVPFLTPHWYRVEPNILKRGDQFRPGPPPKVGSAQLKREVDECIQMNGNLTVEQKAIVEFMRDGPRSTGQSGHWMRFAQDVSRREGYDLDTDVKLFFAVATTAFDTFIACWDGKRYYDSSRPWTLVRWYYRGQKIRGYLGPCKGFAMIPAEHWHPYSPANFVTPPFPGYPSGHSTVSAGCARMLRHFTGSNRFGATAYHIAGSITESGCGVKQMQAYEGKAPAHLPDSKRVALKLETFSGTAELAGISRVLGGYHIQSDNKVALALGRRCADYMWPVLQRYFDGTVKPRHAMME